MGLGVLKLKMTSLDVVYDGCGSLRIWDRLTGGIMVVVGDFWEVFLFAFCEGSCHRLVRRLVVLSSRSS